MTDNQTFAGIKKQTTNQLKYYLEQRKKILLEGDFEFDREWLEKNLWEIGDELIQRGEMTWKELEGDYITPTLTQDRTSP